MVLNPLAEEVGVSTYIAVARHVEQHWVVTIDDVGTSAGATLMEAMTAARCLLQTATDEDGDRVVHLSSFVVEDGTLRVLERSHRRRVLRGPLRS